MKIYGINNSYHTQFMSAEPAKQQERKRLSTTQQQTVIAAASVVGLSILAWLIFRGKRPPKAKTEIKPDSVIQTTKQEMSKHSKPVIPPKPTIPEPSKPEPLPIAPQPDSNKPNVPPLPYDPKITKIENFKPYFDGEYEVINAKFKNGSTITYKKVKDEETFKDILVFNNEDKLVRRITQYKKENGQMWSRVYEGDETKILENPKNFPKSIYDSDFLIKEFSGEAKKPLGKSDISEGYERLTRVAFPNGTAKTYQGFFNKNKRLHDYTIYYEKFNNNLGCFDRLHEAQPEYVVKYNYAYKDGKLFGIAKQDLLRYNNWHGVYSNGGFDPFPMYVDLRNGEGFKEFKGNLDIKYPEFNPDNF